MMNVVIPVLEGFLEEQELLKKKNEEKVEDCIKRFHETKNFPRKKKKSVRKQLNKEYSFWVSISKWHNDWMNGKHI